MNTNLLKLISLATLSVFALACGGGGGGGGSTGNSVVESPVAVSSLDLEIGKSNSLHSATVNGANDVTIDTGYGFDAYVVNFYKFMADDSSVDLELIGTKSYSAGSTVNITTSLTEEIQFVMPGGNVVTQSVGSSLSQGDWLMTEVRAVKTSGNGYEIVDNAQFFHQPDVDGGNFGWTLQYDWNGRNDQYFLFTDTEAGKATIAFDKLNLPGTSSTTKIYQRTGQIGFAETMEGNANYMELYPNTESETVPNYAYNQDLGYFVYTVYDANQNETTLVSKPGATHELDEAMKNFQAGLGDLDLMKAVNSL